MLDDIEAIKQLKARYFRTLDTKDWAGFRAVFAPDARIDFADEGGRFDSAEAFIAAIQPALANVVTIHHGHTSEITLRDDRHADGIWSMEDRLRFPPNRSVAQVHGFGFYHESYLRTTDSWQIESVRLERLARDVIRRQSISDRSGGV